MQALTASDAESPTLEDQTVLVTGGAGFVGSHLATALTGSTAGGAPEVRVIDDLSNGRPANVPETATLFRGDVRDAETLASAMDGVDVVFHQAGLVSVPASVEDPLESRSRNVDATLAILERARREDARVVLASSVAIYGNPETVPISESDTKTPTSPYGVDKLAIDHYARLYNEHYGLETVALRYFNVYGPRQSGGDYSGVISTFLEQAQAGVPLTVHGDGSQTRDFVHVSDVVRANLAAARTDAVGTAVNVGTGESVTIRELAELIRSITGSDSDIVHTDPREGDVDRSRADISRARASLGFEPRVPLREGLADLVGTPAANR